jgi:hypothetical protein
MWVNTVLVAERKKNGVDVAQIFILLLTSLIKCDNCVEESKTRITVRTYHFRGH